MQIIKPDGTVKEVPIGTKLVGCRAKDIYFSYREAYDYILAVGEERFIRYLIHLRGTHIAGATKCT